MLIQQTTYPEFVADQILSSEHLNRLFGYLDEQERLTRANLLGIGIVCGLEIKLNGGGTELVISKGSGITSKGYLVSIPDSGYTGYVQYDISRKQTYKPFTDIFLEDPNSGFKAYELTNDTAAAGYTALSANFLQDYIVMMYVELREQTAQNCDTNDCDYDGIMVNVNLKPLLIPVSFATLFISGAADVGTSIANLPEIALRRFDVTATKLEGSAVIIEGYRSILTNQVSQLRTALNSVFISLYPFVSDEYQLNPFPDLIDDVFYFLNDGTYPLNDMLHIQYYYDLLADLYNVYDRVRESGDQLIGMCNPDEYLFPQHLMLGPATTAATDGTKVSYRNYFMPSGAVKSCCSGIGDLRLEFKRLVLLLDRFELPEVYTEKVNVDTPRDTVANQIRITPDIIGDVPLSKKTIPFYYDVTEGTDQLYRHWDYAKTAIGHADRNLSYNADKYRTGATDDPILKPLYYDLEPYNFFRCEGHIGTSFRTAVNTILNIRNQHRLPFEVMAIRTSQPTESLFKKLCCGDGLELGYDIVRREWEAVVGETIEFIQANLVSTKQLLGFNGSDADETTLYLDKLQKVKTYLVNDMSAFMPKYDEFMGKYEEIELESERLRLKVYSQLGEQGSGFTFAEDLIDHLDAMAHSTKKGAFRAVYQAWVGLGESLEATLTLGQYLQQHPGITHKAGAPAGGTLVLVYHTESEDQDDTTLDVDRMLAQLPEGTVIADFYLPYLCCSDCTPVAVTIGDGKAPVEKPTISIAGNITKVCNDKDNRYKLTISPDTANVNAMIDGTGDTNGIVTKDGSDWVFVPALVTVPDNKTYVTVKITAENAGQTASLQLLVYAKPELDFTVTFDAANPNVRTFIPVCKHADKVDWSFGDGQTQTSYTPNAPLSHQYPALTSNKTYTVTLSATNDICGSSTSQPRSFDIPASQPCNGVKSTCRFVWPYSQFTQVSGGEVSTKMIAAPADQNRYAIAISILQYSVGGNSQFGQSTTITVPSIDFATVWPKIYGYLNPWLAGLPNGTGISLGTSFNAYSDYGYLIPVSYYPCRGMEFVFEFEFYLLINGVPQTKYHYLFDNTGTYVISSLGARKFLYKDPSCQQEAQAEVR